MRRRRAERSSPNEDAGHAVAHTAQHFVGDGVTALGPLPRGDGLVTLRTDEDDFVTDSDIGVGPTIDHDLIHGDRAGDGPALSTDEDTATVLGQSPRHTVGIAN